MKKNNYEIRNTLGMFDFLKGSIMLIVMLSHTSGLFDFMQGQETLFGNYNPLVLVLYIFTYILGVASMPIMFILSGYGFRKTTLKKCLKKQCKTLLIPYIVSMFLVAIVKFFFLCFVTRNIHSSLEEASRSFINILLGYSAASPNWFLLALIIGNLIFNQLLNLLEGKKLLLVVVLIACAGWYLSLGRPVPFCLSQGLIATLYIYVGYFSKKKKFFVTNNTLRKKVLIILGTFLFSMVLKGFGDDLNMAHCVYTLGPISIIGNIIISMGYIYIFLLLNRFNSFLISQIRRIGRYSFYVLCIHSIELKSFGEIIQDKFVQNWTGSLILRNLIQFGVRAVAVILATYTFVKFKRKIMVRIPKFNKPILQKEHKA